MSFEDAVANIKYGEMNEEQRRVVRVEWLIDNMDENVVRQAEKEDKVEPGTVEFVKQVRDLVAKIRSGEKQIGELTKLHHMRLEDAYQWSHPAALLTEEEKLKVAAWCRRDGHVDQAEAIEAQVEEDRKR